MRIRMGACVAAVAVALVLWSHAGTLAQTLAPYVVNGKLQVRSSAVDALVVLGGGAFGSTLGLASNNPIVSFSESDAAADNKLWRVIVDGQTWNLQAQTDGGSSSTAISVARSGGTPGAVTFLSGVAVGSGATVVQKVLSGTATWDPKNINGSGDFDSVLVTVTGVTSGSPCVASFTATVSVPMVLQARYDTTNTVRVILVNPDTSAYDPGSGTARVTCFVY